MADSITALQTSNQKEDEADNQLLGGFENQVGKDLRGLAIDEYSRRVRNIAM